MQEESPEGGRFKKEVVVDSHSYLLLIRDEGGPPELQVSLSAWNIGVQKHLFISLCTYNYEIITQTNDYMKTLLYSPNNFIKYSSHIN